MLDDGIIITEIGNMYYQKPRCDMQRGFQNHFVLDGDINITHA